MKKLLYLVLIVFAFSAYTATAQKSVDFVPSGAPELKIYSNFNTTSSNNNSVSKFELSRVYLGYNYNFTASLSAHVTLEVGNPGVGNFQFTALLKNGFLQYQKDKFTAKFGMIGTPLFDVQESFWGRRYLFKCFQDEYGFGPSNDLGASISYRFSDKISADFILQNGEGYTSHQSDSTFKAGAGLTIKPVEGVTLRGYYDQMKNDHATQQTVALMAAYSGKAFNIGAEYNNQVDRKLVKGQDCNGYSLSATYFASEKTNLFVRYDYLTSSNKKIQSHEWNYANDGQLVLIGLEYKPITGIRISPNYRGWSPKDDNQKYRSMFFLNLGVDL